MILRHFNSVEEQIAAELTDLVNRLGVLFTGSESRDMHGRAATWARTAVTNLSSADTNRAGRVALDIIAARRPDNVDPPITWWATPLGHAIAAAVGYPGRDNVSHSIAAAMLGVSRGWIGKMANTGSLVRGPGGSVTSESVRLEIRRRRAVVRSE